MSSIPPGAGVTVVTSGGRRESGLTQLEEVIVEDCCEAMRAGETMLDLHASDYTALTAAPAAMVHRYARHTLPTACWNKYLTIKVNGATVALICLAIRPAITPADWRQAATNAMLLYHRLG